MGENLNRLILALANGKIVSIKEIIQILDLKKSQVLNLINWLNEHHEQYGCQIKSIRGRGYRLVINDYQQMYNGLGYQKNKRKIELPNQILEDLLEQDGYISIKELSNNYYISRTKLFRVLKQIKQKLINYQIDVKYVNYSGIILIGEEKIIRKYLIDQRLSQNFRENNGNKKNYLAIVKKVQLTRIRQKKIVFEEKSGEKYQKIEKNNGFFNELPNEAEKLYIKIHYDYLRDSVDVDQVKFNKIIQMLTKKYKLKNINQQFIRELKICLNRIEKLNNHEFLNNYYMNPKMTFISKDIIKIYFNDELKIKESIAIQNCSTVIENLFATYMDNYHLQMDRVCLLKNGTRQQQDLLKTRFKFLFPMAKVKLFTENELNKIIRFKPDLICTFSFLKHDLRKKFIDYSIINVTATREFNDIYTIDTLFNYVISVEKIKVLRRDVKILKKEFSSKQKLYDYNGWQLFLINKSEFKIVINPETKYFGVNKLYLEKDFYNICFTNYLFNLVCHQIISHEEILSYTDIDLIKLFRTNRRTYE